MSNEQPELQIATPSRWPPRVAYILALVTLIGAVVSWVEVSDAAGVREMVLTSVDSAEARGASDDTLRELMVSHKELGRGESLWRRRRLGLFIASFILLFGGFIGNSWLDVHQRMEWQIREEVGKRDDDDYGGH